MAALQSSPFELIDKDTYKTFTEKAPYLDVEWLSDHFFLQGESEILEALI
jgi:hypothetical protein